MADAGTRAGTVTVLFTDLVASTELRQTLGDDRADELRRDHDRLVRDATAEHNGTEVKSLGDGFMLVFGASAEAVGAAVAMQEAVSRLSRRAPLPISIRVGLSAGDVVWEDGDCFGTPVIEASRLCGAAAAGQILVSDVVRLLAGSRGGHSFTAIGPIDLKGLTEPVNASEVAWESTVEASISLPGALAPRDQGAFVGRAEEREQLATAWKDAATGRRRVALLSGEPGVGKTRLAAELARVAHDEGATILYGRCEEDLGVPYQPFVEALRPYVAACPVEELAEQVAPYGGDLARLVPELAERIADLPGALVADPETERYRLFDAVTSFLGSIVRTAPLVLVLDDLHWAAKPTLLLLRHLTRAEWSGALLVIGTYRDTDLSRTHPLAEMLADLRREGDAERIALHGLDEQEVEQFVAAAAGHELDAEAADLARLLHDETEGNPFFMGQVLRHLVETGAIVEQDGRWVRGAGADEIGIPEGVREVVGRRLARLEPATNEVLAAAATVGREFDRDLLTASAGIDAESVLDALEEGEAAHLITPVDGRRGRYAFVHALVRSTLYDEIPTTRRLRLHRRIGEALEARGGDAHLDELAYHFAEAAALGEVGKAVEYGRRAAQHATARLAYEEAVADYERAIGSLDPDSPGDRTTRAELLVDLGQALWIVGERARARELLDDAFSLAKECGREDLLARAAIIRGGVRAWTEAGVVDEELIQMLDEALSLAPEGDSRDRAMMTARTASELYFLPGATERRRELSEVAVAMARRLGDPGTLAYVLNAAHWGMFEPGSGRARLAVAREMLVLATESGDRGLEASSRSWLVSDLLGLGDVPGAIAESEREHALVEELRQPDLLWAALVKQAAIAFFTGRIDDALRIGEEALAAGQQAEIETALQMYGVLQLAARRLRGGLEETVEVVAAMVEEYPLVPAWRSAAAYVYRELGRVDEAAAQLEVIAVDDFALLPRDGNWEVGVAILATVCSSLGDQERAAWLYRELVPFQDSVVLAGLPADVLGSAHHFLMLLAATIEEWDDMERHAREALARNDAIGAPAWIATTRFELATILARRAHAGDAERARQLLAECLETCDVLALPYLAGRARAVLDEVNSSA